MWMSRSGWRGVLGSGLVMLSCCQPAVATLSGSVVHANHPLATTQVSKKRKETHASTDAVGLSIAAELEAAIAWQCIERDDYDQARREARQAVALWSRQPMAHAVLSYALAESGALENAEIEARKAVQLAPYLSYAHASLALCFQLQNKKEEAKAAYKVAFSKDPDDAMAYNDYGNLLELGSQEAEDSFKKSIQINPLIPEAHEALGRTYMAQSQYREATEQLVIANSLNDRMSRWHFELGNAYLNLGEYSQSSEAYKQALLISSKTNDLNSQSRETLFVNLVAAYRRLGRFQDAEAIGAEGLALYPRSGQIMNSLGVAYYDEEKWSEAAAQFEAARATIAIDVNYAANLANAYYHLKRYSDAEQACSVAIDFSPQAPTAYNVLGLVNFDQKRFAEAARLFRSAIDRDPTEAVFHANLGSTDVQLKAYEEAESECLKAFELNPRTGAAFNALGSLLADRQDWPAALTQFKIAISIRPKEPVYHANLAGCYLRLGKADQAREEARQAQSEGLTDHWVFKELSMH